MFPDDFHIYVGKNNRQNEYLTLKFANKEDLWLHVQNMPGSHVVIKKDNKEIPDTTLEKQPYWQPIIVKEKTVKTYL